MAHTHTYCITYRYLCSYTLFCKHEIRFHTPIYGSLLFFRFCSLIWPFVPWTCFDGLNDDMRARLSTDFLFTINIHAYTISYFFNLLFEIVRLHIVSRVTLQSPLIIIESKMCVSTYDGASWYYFCVYIMHYAHTISTFTMLAFHSSHDSINVRSSVFPIHFPSFTCIYPTFWLRKLHEDFCERVSSLAYEKRNAPLHSIAIIHSTHTAFWPIILFVCHC